jgi:molecular chaperone DnaK (HSP70)
MPGRLAIDFGTSNTVVAVWDETRREGMPFLIPDYGCLALHGDDQIPIIPSLIHYAEDRRRWLGHQVLERSLYQSDRTFRWMKRYIANRSPVKKRLDGYEVSHFDAGRDFLSTVLTFAATELNIDHEEIALTAPVEAFEHYENWLTEVVEAAGMPGFRLIDEASAAALGYGAHLQPGNVYLIFDFGGGTLDVAVVLIEEEDQAQTGRRCRVQGKAGAEIGGSVIDGWLFQDVLRRNNRSDTDDDVRQVSRALLVECERAKERLSHDECVNVSVINHERETVLTAQFTRSGFEDLLDERELFTHIGHTIRRALNAARERGYNEESIIAVFMVGGSSLIPSVQKTVQRIFGRDKVMVDRPLDAVARGAAAYVAGAGFDDHIQHDYAIRWVNPQKGDYDYRVIVRRGTPYPSQKPVAQLTVKAAHDGQTQLGIAIFEMGEQHQHSGQQVELVFDPSGAARVVKLAPDELVRRAYFWLNEQTPTFLSADPPGKQGEARFAIEFGIDANKRLLVTARDLMTSRLIHKDFPVVRLT